MGAVHYAHGLCRGCYDEVIQYSTCDHGFFEGLRSFSKGGIFFFQSTVPVFLP